MRDGSLSLQMFVGDCRAHGIVRVLILGSPLTSYMFILFDSPLIAHMFILADSALYLDGFVLDVSPLTRHWFIGSFAAHFMAYMLGRITKGLGYSSWQQS